LLSRGNVQKVIAFFVALNKTSWGSEDPLKSPEYKENSPAKEEMKLPANTRPRSWKAKRLLRERYSRQRKKRKKKRNKAKLDEILDK